MAHTVRIRRHSIAVSVSGSDTILESALAQGVNYPHSCQAGLCGTCKSRLLSGAVDMLAYEDFALTDEERASGLVLACRAQPRSDCEIAWLEYDGTEVHPLVEAQGRVRAVERATHDVVRVFVDIAHGPAMVFSAGQYAEVTFAGQPTRDYSFANRPDQETLEFNIRRMEGGAASFFATTRLAPGDQVALKGPYGTAYVREFHTGPILAVAGATGLAPIRSILETALAHNMRQPIHLYFGVREERDIYDEARLRDLAAKYANLRVTIVLSNPAGPTARRTGFVHEAVAADIEDFEGFKAYAAGPPEMVEALQRMLRRRGMRAEDVHADAFYTEAEKAAVMAKAR